MFARMTKLNLRHLPNTVHETSDFQKSEEVPDPVSSREPCDSSEAFWRGPGANQVDGFQMLRRGSSQAVIWTLQLVPEKVEYVMMNV